MPRWDFECPNCGRVEEHTYRTYEESETDPPFCKNKSCDWSTRPTMMRRLPSSGSFSVKGFNASNGYSR